MDNQANLELMRQIADCRVCEKHLPLGPRPVARISDPRAPILLIGQAPGTKVHASGVPWDDASGKRLRSWLGVEATAFYDQSKFAILPMGLCYPGKQNGGDAPPRPECAPLWHEPALKVLPARKLTLLIGAYALARYLGSTRKATLAETVMAWQSYIEDGFLPLPHPSPRNQLWLKQNPWFELEIIPQLRTRVAALIPSDH